MNNLATTLKRPNNLSFHFLFSGLILKPNKKYSQVVSKPFRVTHATLDICTSEINEKEYVQIWVQVAGTDYLLCSLSKHTSHGILDIAFLDKESIIFYTKGLNNVHLTGNLIPEDTDFKLNPFGDELR